MGPYQLLIYTGLLSRLLAEYAANQKCSAVLLCSADSIYPAWACNQNRTSNEETEKQKQVCSEKAATERVCTAFYK